MDARHHHVSGIVLGAHDRPLVLIAAVAHRPIGLPSVGVDGRSRLHCVLDDGIRLSLETSSTRCSRIRANPLGCLTSTAIATIASSVRAGVSCIAHQSSLCHWDRLALIGAFAATVLGQTELFTDNLESARVHLVDAARLSREVGAVGGESLARMRLGETLLHLGDRAGARAQLEEALELGHISPRAQHCCSSSTACCCRSPTRAPRRSR